MTRLAVYEHVLELVAMWFWRSLWKVVGNFRLEILECYGQQMSFRELFIKMLTFSCVRSLLCGNISSSWTIWIKQSKIGCFEVSLKSYRAFGCWNKNFRKAMIAQVHYHRSRAMIFSSAISGFKVYWSHRHLATCIHDPKRWLPVVCFLDDVYVAWTVWWMHRALWRVFRLRSRSRLVPHI